MHIISIQPEAIFQALADETRLRLIHVTVATGEESCLCELVDSLLEPSYKLSRHLKILRQMGLLSSHKEGRWVYHRLVMAPSYLVPLYATVNALPDLDGIYGADLERFHERLCLREGGRCRIGYWLTNSRQRKRADGLPELHNDRQWRTHATSLCNPQVVTSALSGHVATVGNGVNDAPALVEATVGFDHEVSEFLVNGYGLRMLRR